MSENSNSNFSSDFAAIFFRQLTNCAMDYLLKHPQTNSNILDPVYLDVCMLLQFVTSKGHPPSEREVNVLTSILARYIEPSLRRRAPELWEQIDKIATTYAIYSIPNLKTINPDGSIELEEEKPEEKESVGPSEDFLRRQERMLVANVAEVEHEELSDESEEASSPELVIEVPDAKARAIEVHQSPTRENTRPQPPPSPRVLRTKIILWKTAPTNKRS